jgi:hypothetical protein
MARKLDQPITPEYHQRGIDNGALSDSANNVARVRASLLPMILAADEPSASMQEVLGALDEIRDARHRLVDAERTLIDTARRQGVTWSRIARALGVGSAQAAQQRHKRLGGPSESSLPLTSTSPEGTRYQ